MKRFDTHFILVPLTVMLMLTLIVGYSAFQLTQGWERASNDLTVTLVRAQILNNIQWQLRQAHAHMQQNRTDEAVKLWRDVKSQVSVMNHNARVFTVPPSLNLFLADDNNLRRIPLILQEDYFNYNLSQLQQTLIEFQQNSRQVTLIITASMVTLGGLLMSITAWDLGRLFRELAESRDLNNKLQEEERQRIAQELHDAVIQELVDLKRSYRPEKVDRLVDDIRRICHNLKPQALEDLGLCAALELLADDLRRLGNCQVSLNFSEQELHHLPKPYELPLFRIVQELFNNIRRPAEATQVTLTLVYEPSASPILWLSVRDNGKGFESETISRGLGLTGVGQRIGQLGGKMSLTSNPGTGTTFQALIPVVSEGVAA